MRKALAVALSAFLSLLILVDTARADDQKVPLDKVPTAVLQAVKKKFPTAKIEEAAKEVEDGKTIYEIEIEVSESDITVSLKEDGTITEIEKAIAVKDLPAAVRAALKAKYPAGTLKKAEEVTEGAKVTFEVIVTQDGKKPREVALDKTGKVLEDEAAEEEDD